ncbi:MAG: hypothetical protein JNJ90_10175 [Saprospiraceae bacterium]|nr:hypothetical protein [Saprospiraceae bacterium]
MADPKNPFNQRRLFFNALRKAVPMVEGNTHLVETLHPAIPAGGTFESKTSQNSPP